MCLTAFKLKLIALASMFIDHIGAVFPEYFGLEFRVIGRLAFPIFVYLLAEGFRHTSNPHRFLVRLGVFAIISEPFFDLALRANLQAAEYINMRFLWDNIDFFANTNIFYTLFLGGVSICAIEHLKQSEKPPYSFKSLIALVCVGAPFFVAEALTTDYAAYGVAFILLMYVITDKKLRLAVMAVMCVWQHGDILQFIVEGHAGLLGLYNLMIPATLVTVLLAAFYNGKRGPGFKMMFYVAYPAHLAVLFMFRLIII